MMKYTPEFFISFFEQTSPHDWTTGNFRCESTLAPDSWTYCAVIAFLLFLAFAFWLSWQFFGWKGPAAIIVIWALLSYVHDRFTQRKPL
jgi:hypothetical protein